MWYKLTWRSIRINSVCTTSNTSPAKPLYQRENPLISVLLLQDLNPNLPKQSAIAIIITDVCPQLFVVHPTKLTAATGRSISTKSPARVCFMSLSFTSRKYVPNSVRNWIHAWNSSIGCIWIGMDNHVIIFEIKIFCKIGQIKFEVILFQTPICFYKDYHW